jgi:hypothetical protein
MYKYNLDSRDPNSYVGKNTIDASMTMMKIRAMALRIMDDNALDDDDDDDDDDFVG